MPKSPGGRPRAELDSADLRLLDLVTALLADHFFDPDNEAAFLKRYPARKAATGGSRPNDPLSEDQIPCDDGELNWRLDVLGSRNMFRMALEHPAFTARIEGVWQFQQEALRQGRVVERTGNADEIEKITASILSEVAGAEPGEEEINNLLAVLYDDDDRPLIGDNPEEPPPATRSECEQARVLVSRLARRPEAELPIEDRTWLELTPQTLPVLADLLVEAMSAMPRREGRISACLELVTLQLEFVRHRMDRGWAWASQMLGDYQQRLIDLGRDGLLDQADWFAMASALTEARVPVADGIQTALADAGMELAEFGPPEEMLNALRTLSDHMASMVDTPFDVIDSLRAAGPVMPANLRSFMTMELALSPHAVLREAVPLMLLDADSSVRRAAAAAMEQTARADTASPDWLRRAITLRNWIPPSDRTELDRAIRKARAAGVPIGSWPGAAAAGAPAGSPRPDLAFHASMVDGSGAQSIVAVSRSGRKGIVAGLLLKHGVGVTDAWLDTEVTRANINKMLRDLTTEVPSDQVDRSYVDAAVQHAIATGLTQGAVPTEKLLAIAECVGGQEWKDRGLDVAGEAERLFTNLEPEGRTADAVQASLERGAAWMQDQPIAASWFEFDPNVRQVIAKVPRRDNASAIRLVQTEVLSASRMAWAERFLLMALWCKAANSASYQGWADDFVILTHALADGTRLESIRIMDCIAAQTVRAARTKGW